MWSQPKRPVPSGSFVISRSRNEILEAYLGTCVGVALWDRSARIGGLLHLLLPEPTGMDKLYQPENYASTGLPLFIHALCEAGASKDRLEACIAGGALVGPLCERDLNLDIGGRTAELVESILQGRKIPVRKAETGGFFTCRLMLNLHDLEASIEPLGLQMRSAKEAQFRKPSPQELDAVMEKVRPIPQVALKIIRLIHDQNRGMSDLALEVRQDQVISAKVIRLCRSAFMGMKTDIDSIDRALVMLGEKRFLQLVISASLEEFYPENGLGYSLCKGGVYKHALGTAMLSETLANFTGAASPEMAYTTGLLHDIGKVVLDQYIAPVSTLFYRETQVEGANLISVEERAFGVTHTQVGARLADRWSLPPTLTEAIRHHHHPEKAQDYPELVHLAFLADLIMSRFLVGQELDRLDTACLGSCLGKLGIRPNQLPVVIDSIPRGMFRSHTH